ncbi:hypothetical protein MRX96_024701 [Rhipicephalus microplus]
MDSRRFYGIRVPPVGDSEDSCLSDSDSDYNPDTEDAAPADQSGQSGRDTDDEDETQEPSTSSARSFLWKRVNHARTCQPQWEDSSPDPPDEPKAPIGKPHKWGYKILVLCDTHGLVYDFSIYTGNIRPVPGLPDLGASSNDVLELSLSIPENKNYLLFFDNWFTFIKLLVSLHQRGIPALGTARANRISGCRLPSDAEMKKDGRRSHVEREATVYGAEVRVVKWYDSRGVNITSTFGSAEPLGSCQRYDRKKKERCEIQQPAIVKTYNTFMGGVDLLYGLMAYYRFFLKSKKFYLRFFFHFVHMSVVNSWLLYRRDRDALAIAKKEQLDLLAFKASLASCLFNENKDMMKKRDRPSLSVEAELERKKRRGPTAPTPNAQVRHDNVWPLA